MDALAPAEVPKINKNGKPRMNRTDRTAQEKLKILAHIGPGKKYRTIDMGASAFGIAASTIKRWRSNISSIQDLARKRPKAKRRSLGKYEDVETEIVNFLHRKRKLGFDAPLASILQDRALRIRRELLKKDPQRWKTIHVK